MGRAEGYIWWTWELELSSHLLKRMADRQFTEVELQRTMEHATAVHNDTEVGRWVAVTRHDSESWEVIVGPMSSSTPRRRRLPGGLEMKQRYLEVTYRRGRPFAAYDYLPRTESDKSVRTERAEGGLIVDFEADGRPIGIEITAPARLNVDQLNALLARLGQPPVGEADMAPLVAA